MKKHLCFLPVGAILVLFFIFSSSLSSGAETMEGRCAALSSAGNLDDQLRILHTLATENAAMLELGGWENDLMVPAAKGLPSGLIPKDWDAYNHTAT